MRSNRWRRSWGLVLLLAALAACGQSAGDQAGQKNFGPAGIYVWEPNEGGSATTAQVASGFFPVWVK